MATSFLPTIEAWGDQPSAVEERWGLGIWDSQKRVRFPILRGGMRRGMPAVIDRRLVPLRDPAQDQRGAAPVRTLNSESPIPASSVPAYSSPPPPRPRAFTGTTGPRPFLALAVEPVVFYPPGALRTTYPAQTPT